MDSHQLMLTLFGVPRTLIGMLHVGSLAGSPLHRQRALDLGDQIEDAVSLAEID